MGRRNGKSIVKQVADTFSAMARYGESRHEEKQERRERGEENPGATDGIYSIQTMINYSKHASAFAVWAKEIYHSRTLMEARQHVPAYLQMRIDQGLSPWTVHLDTAAVSKLYGCKMRDWGIVRPERKREGIKRSRQAVARDKHFNPENNRDLDAFLRATGMRRCEAERVRPENVSVDGASVHVVRGKGGKERIISILPDEIATIRALADAANNEGRKKLFGQISENVDIHSYRRDFAQRRYAYYVAQGMTEYHGPKGPIYYCRGDKVGTWFYRGAMLLVSKQLGHNREDVIASSYLV